MYLGFKGTFPTRAQRRSFWAPVVTNQVETAVGLSLRTWCLHLRLLRFIPLLFVGTSWPREQIGAPLVDPACPGLC